MGLSSSLSIALITGMVATFNPCGFALLPSYLAYFVGSDSYIDGTTSAALLNRAKNIFQALIVGLTMSAAFLSFFGFFGIAVSTFINQGSLQEILQWATFIFGILIVPIGIFMILGKSFNLKIPRLQRTNKGKGLGSVFLFGLSFAIISLGCTAPAFFAQVVNSFSRQGWFEGVLIFLAYGLGISLIVLVLTLAAGMAKTEVAVAMRKIIPHIGKISGVVLIFTGVFLAFYGWWEIQVLKGNLSTNWFVDTSDEFQTTLTNWISDVGATHIAIIIAFILTVSFVFAITSTQQASEENKKQLLLWRYSLLGVLAVTWLVLEIVRYDWELILLPLWNTLVDLPGRIGGWFANPLRWSVPFEVLLAVFIIAITVLGIRRKRKPVEAELASSIN